jgi:two-component system LytT family sensor kinase
MANALKSKSNLIVHSLIWLTCFGLFYLHLSQAVEAPNALLRSVTIIGFVASVFYFNTEILVPKLLQAKRPYLYILSLIGTGILVVIGLNLIHRHIFIDDFKPETLRGPDNFRGGRGRHPGGMGNRPHWIVRSRVFIDLFLTVVAMFIGTAYKTSRLALKRTQEATDLRSEQLQTEMKFLRSQINPHFLFNALNNAYSLAVMKSDKAPEVLLKLSEMLRYLLYECNEANVFLEKEISYIHTFIELQQLKTESPQKIEFEVDNLEPKDAVSPMLFIPFIENSFKHSKIEDTDRGWVKMRLVNNASELRFEISNSLPDAEYTKDKQGGIGLDNVRRRLALLHADKHQLDIEKRDNGFFVTLSIRK